MKNWILEHSEYPNQVHFIFGKEPSPFDGEDRTGMVWIEVLDKNGVLVHPSDPLVGWYTRDDVRVWLQRFRRAGWFRMKKEHTYT